MIDTVRFRISEPLPAALIAEWLYSQKPHKDGSMWRSYSNKFRGPFGTIVQIRYYPQDTKMEPIPLILVETSLPNFLFGNNIKMLSNVNVATSRLESFLGDPLGRKVDLSKAEIDRIDLCYNHYVGSHVDDYIKYLFEVEHPTRLNKPYYPTDGVHFYAPTACLTFYNKFKESGNILAKGILREELSLRKKWSVRRELNKPLLSQPVFIDDFTAEVVERILQKENERLGINNVVIADKGLALKVLMGKYGTKRGMNLYGYMCAFGITKSKDMINQGISKQTISRNKASVRNAGLANHLINQDVKLPSLVINLLIPVE